jgi:hypothetical protein
MATGGWWFTPDPFVFSDNGHVLNGQHRMLAVMSTQTLHPIEFVLVTGVEDRATLIMDEARRTPTDRRAIAMKYAS